MAVTYPLIWYGVLTVPLGDFNCIYNLYPLLTVFLAHFWLKEALPSWFVLVPSSVLSLGGVLLVSQPTFIFGAASMDSPDPFGLAATVLAAIGWTFVLVLIRTVTHSHFLQLEFAASFLIFTATVPVLMVLNHFVIRSRLIGDWMAADWSWSGFDCLCLVFAGCAGFADLVCVTAGYQLGDAASIGWIEYLQIPLTYVLQIWVLDQGIDYLEVIGAVAVTVGCVLPISRELWLYLKAERVPETEEFQTETQTEADYEPLI